MGDDHAVNGPSQPDQPRPGEPHAASRGRRIVQRVVGSLVSLGLFLWILRAGALPLVPPRQALGRVEASTVIYYTIIWGLCLVIRASRWIWLLRPVSRVPFAASLRISLIGTGAVLLLPLRAGEFVRPFLLRRYDVPFVTGATTVGIERVVDGLFVGLLLLFALSLDPGQATQAPSIVPTVARSALIGFGLVLFVLIALSRSQELTRRLIEGGLGWVSPRAASRVVKEVDRVFAGLASFRDGSNLLRFLVTTLVFWALYVVGMMVMLTGSGLPEIGWVRVCAVTALLALGFMLPAPPGFFGAFQTAYYAGLLLYLPGERVTNQGAVAVFLTYVVQLVVVIAVAAVCWIIERRQPVRA